MIQIVLKVAINQAALASRSRGSAIGHKADRSVIEMSCKKLKKLYDIGIGRALEKGQTTNLYCDE